jgi:hypothetical protein
MIQMLEVEVIEMRRLMDVLDVIRSLLRIDSPAVVFLKARRRRARRRSSAVHPTATPWKHAPLGSPALAGEFPRDGAISSQRGGHE